MAQVADDPQFLPPKGKVLDYLGKTLCNLLKPLDLFGHTIYLNDRHAKQNFVVEVPDLYDRRR